MWFEAAENRNGNDFINVSQKSKEQNVAGKR